MRVEFQYLFVQSSSGKYLWKHHYDTLVIKFYLYLVAKDFLGNLTVAIENEKWANNHTYVTKSTVCLFLLLRFQTKGKIKREVGVTLN